MKQQLDPELAAIKRRAEQEHKRMTIERIEQLTSRVPPKVLAGDVMNAKHWKEHASKARSLMRRDRVSLAQLQDALTLLRQYE